MITMQEAHLPPIDTESLAVTLPWRQPTYLSLRAAGDLGPSGNPGHQGRTVWSDQIGLIDPAGVPGQALSCSQTHSLRVLVLPADQPAQLWEGTWSSTNSLEISHEILQSWDSISEPESLRQRVGELEADGILTNQNLGLAVTVADCLPIGLSYGSWRGALHSGWQGTGILAVALSFLETTMRKGPKPSDELALLFGPSVAAYDYPVPPDRARVFASRFGAATTPTLADGQPALDIRLANQQIVQAWKPGQDLSVSITVYQDSTVSHPALHSYRRDGPNYGRMAFIVGS